MPIPIAAPGADDELVDHTAGLLWTMADCAGMGLTLSRYPAAVPVLEAHAGHLAGQRPSAERFMLAAALADHLASTPPEDLGVLRGDAARLARAYVEVLDREEWCRTAREEWCRAAPGEAAEADMGEWLITEPGARLGLKAFADYYA